MEFNLNTITNQEIDKLNKLELGYLLKQINYMKYFEIHIGRTPRKTYALRVKRELQKYRDAK